MPLPSLIKHFEFHCSFYYRYANWDSNWSSNLPSDRMLETSHSGTFLLFARTSLQLGMAGLGCLGEARFLWRHFELVWCLALRLSLMLRGGDILLLTDDLLCCFRMIEVVLVILRRWHIFLWGWPLLKRLLNKAQPLVRDVWQHFLTSERRSRLGWLLMARAGSSHGWRRFHSLRQA